MELELVECRMVVNTKLRKIRKYYNSPALIAENYEASSYPKRQKTFGYLQKRPELNETIFTFIFALILISEMVSLFIGS